MMNDKLIDYCNALEGAAADAQVWINDNTEKVPGANSLLKELRQARRLYRRLGTALSRKMCAGVFGPSQAGKSYLLSALARDGNGNLTACFGQTELDFLTEINPGGGKESTGLVTRFTTTRPASFPDGHPIHLRLLSETDIVKVILNTFYSDCRHKEAVNEDAIRTAVEGLSASRKPEIVHGVTLDDIEELIEYMQSGFSNEARVQSLHRIFWPVAKEAAPYLSLDDRIRLYAVLWNNIPEFTSLLRGLLMSLAKLNFATDVWCTLDALTPRDISIIDVETLRARDDSSLLSVALPDGTEVSLPRFVVTALTAELTIVMKNRPADYFEHTDLLDFPGYRSRYKFTNIAEELEAKPELGVEMFLRGKVAYLFQRYCTDRELTSMLLCIASGNQEVQDLPEVINRWIAETHGDTPAQRAKTAQDSLFFVLTKSDEEFAEKTGDPDPRARWDIRLHSSLLGFFGNQHNWPVQWKPGQAFNNLFLLRNPNFKFRQVMELDENEREIGIRRDAKALVEKLQEAFVSSEQVRRHFKSPYEAWNALMSLNDGGISYLRDHLSPLCDPEIKRRQILNELLQQNEELSQRLGKFYIPNDRGEIIKARGKFCNILKKELSEPRSRFRLHFAEILRTFNMTALEIAELQEESYRQFSLRVKASQVVEDAEEIQVDNDADPFGFFEGFFDEEQADEDAKPAEPAEDLSEEGCFAEAIMEAWENKMRATARTPRCRQYFGLPQATFVTFVNEIRTTAQRLGLTERLTKQFKDFSSFSNNEKSRIVMRQAAYAANEINNFVSSMGLGRGNDGETLSVNVNGKTISVFAPPEEVEGIPNLPERIEDDARKMPPWVRDWLMVFGAQVLENANFDGRTLVDVAQNERLLRILNTLRSQAPD